MNDKAPTTMTINVPKQPSAIAPRIGETHRSDILASERSASGEISSRAKAAQAEALVKAQYSVALARPSSFLEVRSKLMAECERPSFADVAWYSKPVGSERVEGPSIRFAEAFMRARGNMGHGATIVHDDPDMRIIMVAVTCFESNVVESREIVMKKQVERANGTDREVLGMRKNSKGNPTYLVRAFDHELADKEAAEISKVLRGLIMRLCPGDLKDECHKTVMRMREKAVREDPNGAVKALIDKLELDHRVKPSMVADYLGHAVDLMTGDEILDLQNIYAALKDGEARWSEVMAQKKAKAEEASGAVPSNPIRDQVIASVAKPASPAPVVQTAPVPPAAPVAPPAAPAPTPHQPPAPPPPQPQTPPAPSPQASATPPKAATTAGPVPAKTPPAPDPEAEKARKEWIALGDALIEEYAKLTPVPGESKTKATDRAAAKLGTRKGKTTAAARERWTVEARATVAEVMISKGDRLSRHLKADALVPVAALQPSLALVPPPAAEPEPEADREMTKQEQEFLQSVEWYQTEIAKNENYRGEQEEWDDVYRRAGEQLGIPDMTSDATRKAWLDKADKIYSGLQDPA